MKKRKAEVDYSKGTGATVCKNCVSFRDGNGGGGHWCTRVAGLIDPRYWCILFKKKGA